MTVDRIEGPVLVVLTADLVSHADAVENVLKPFASQDSQHQLLDRVKSKAVKLPAGHFKHIYIASYPETSLVDLDASTVQILADSLQPEGQILGSVDFSNALPALLSGLMENPLKSAWIKPAAVKNSAAPVALTRRSGNKKSVIPKFKKLSIGTKRDTTNDDSDDDIMDENDLIDADAALDASTIVYPAKCDPGNGKRRRKACKDCTCGLKEIEEQEEAEQEAKQNAVVFNSNDITEIDFTVVGKPVGSCGSCALGDAFRCDGCPYLGLPPFKPGEIVTVAGLGDDDL